MEHLHAPPGAECVTIALEQIESARSAGLHAPNLPFDRKPAQEETPKRSKHSKLS